MLGPFIDTVIICLVTALVIVISGVYQTSGDGMAGVELTAAALESGVSWFPYVLAIAVFLFAYSTMITWSYYGVKSVGFLFGGSELAKLIYKIFFCLCIVIGASTQLESIILFTDAMIFSMGIPNIIGLFLLAGVIRKDVRKYIAKLKAA